jgi:tetratricopeptide (TPR) repeat protein
MSNHHLTIMLTLLILAGCSTTAHRQTPQTTAENPAALPYTSTAIAPEALNKDILYNYLAGEIGIQRGAWEEAYDHLMLAAKEAKDSVAASKAARLAWRQDDLRRAVAATDLWVEFDPNNLSARQLAMLAALRDKALPQAQKQAESILKIADAKGKDGFLLLSAALATTKDKEKLVLIKKLTDQYPDSAQAHYAQALVSTQEKQFEAALTALKHTQKLDADWDKPYLLRVQIFALQGNEAAAEKVLARAAKEHPSPAMLEAYGRLLMQKKRYPEALTYFQQALSLSPANHELLYVIGVLALQTKDWELAKSTWERLRDDPQYGKEQEAWYFLGQLEELQGNLKKATNNYQQVKTGRLTHDAQIRTAILTEKLGNHQQARELFRALRLTTPQKAVEIYIAEAQNLKELHKPESALEIYDEAIEAYPSNADLLYARGLLAADMEKIQIAEDDFKAALRIIPEDADTLNALGYTLADQTDRLEEALAYIKKALKLNPDSPAILDSMGWTLFKMKRHEEALTYLKKAADQLDDPEIFSHLAQALWAVGNKDQARQVLDKAIDSFPDDIKLKRVSDKLK